MEQHVDNGTTAYFLMETNCPQMLAICSCKVQQMRFKACLTRQEQKLFFSERHESIDTVSKPDAVSFDDVLNYSDKDYVVD